MSWMWAQGLSALRRQGIAVGQAAQGSALLSAAPTQSGTVLDAIKALVPRLSDVQLWAVPKRKVTPHRQGMRNSTKYIRFVPVVAQCSKCKRVFEQHATPRKCPEEECPAFNMRRRPDTAAA